MRKPIFVVGLLLGVGTYVGLGGSGCGGGSSTAASSSGAFGVVTVNGKQKLYLPLKGQNSNGNGQIAVVDVGATGNGVAGVKALITHIDLKVTDLPTCTGGTDTVIVAAGTNTETVWFIDPTTDTVTGTLSLDGGRSQFSGGGGFVNGIVADPEHNQAILAVWNGFAYIDLKTKTVTGFTVTAPSENYGFDSVRELVLAPFYDCTQSLDQNGMPPAICSTYVAGNGMPMMAGLNVIRLVGDAGIPYTYQNPNAADPTNPVGTKPDSASIDTATGLAVVPDEGGGTQYILDMSKATYDDTGHTFTAPVKSSIFLSETGVAVESSSHLAFWESEYSSGVAAVDLNAAYNSGGIPVEAQMPSPPPGTNSWSNLGDPHGVAVTTGIQSGSPVGFVVDDSSDQGVGSSVWVARVDLPKMISLGSSSDISSAVTFLDATTPESDGGM
jgi:hypothetical protein